MLALEEFLPQTAMSGLTRLRDVVFNAHVPTVHRVGMSTRELAAHVFLGGSAVRRGLNGLRRTGLVTRLGAIDDFHLTRDHFWIRA